MTPFSSEIETSTAWASFFQQWLISGLIPKNYDNLCGLKSVFTVSALLEMVTFRFVFCVCR